MTAMRDPIDLESRRRGRPSMVVNDVLRAAVKQQRDEMTVRQKEAIDLVETCLPVLQRLEWATFELGPVANQLVAFVETELRNYKRKWANGPKRAA